VRNPWLSDSSDAELEALQTDVMRFVAILGLCLAAIFSMVQRASLDQAAPAITLADSVAPSSPISAKRAPTQAKPNPTQAERTPTQAKPIVAETVTQTESQIGFSLEFASAADLMALLESGQIQFYAELDGQFWTADRRGRFAIAPAPASYYRMDSSTVPEALIGSLLRSAATATAKASWGVVLPPAIVEQMDKFTSTREGGRLLILSTGRVELE
jgi:hypothetical protein